MELKNKFISWIQGKLGVLRWISLGLNVIAFLVVAAWLIEWKWYPLGTDRVLEWEPLLIILTGAAVTLKQSYKWLLDEAEYSPAYALAIGYVNNFLGPVITQLLEKGEDSPMIYIYRAKNISDIYNDNIDRVSAEIENRNFELKKIKLKLKHGRARDVLTIKKSKKELVYFDFPNTLKSLSEYIDYKIDSRRNESSVKKKKELTDILLSKFYGRIDTLLNKKNLTDYVKYCDHNLEFDFKFHVK